MAKEDKLKGKPRTVGAAVKKNEKFFYDKKGVKKLAVTAATLKKEGKTLRQWANDFGKSEKKTTVKKPMRPRARNQISDRVGAIIKTEPIEVTTLPGRDDEKRLGTFARDRTDNNSASSDRGKNFGTRVRKRKPGGFDPLGIAGRKTFVSAIEKKQKLKSYTFKQWDAMSEAKRKNLRLPIKNYPGSKKLKVSQRPLK